MRENNCGARARANRNEMRIVRCSLVRRFATMSSNDVFSKLSSPLHDLVTGSAQQDQQQLGVSENDQAEIAQWVEKAAQPDFVKSDACLVCFIMSQFN